MVQLLSQLREPPVPGRFYMVPVVKYWHYGRFDAWPVFGPLHHDRGLIQFPHLHYHLDPRFFSAAQVRYGAQVGQGMRHDAMRDTPDRHASRNVLVDDEPFRLSPIPRKPTLTKRRCRAATWEYTPGVWPQWLDGLESQFDNAATAIRRPDGRLLCPHRKADLSSLARNPDGTVTCPLHGLRVQCASPAPGNLRTRSG